MTTPGAASSPGELPSTPQNPPVTQPTLSIANAQNQALDAKLGSVFHRVKPFITATALLVAVGAAAIVAAPALGVAIPVIGGVGLTASLVILSVDALFCCAWIGYERSYDSRYREAIREGSVNANLNFLAQVKATDLRFLTAPNPPNDQQTLIPKEVNKALDLLTRDENIDLTLRTMREKVTEAEKGRIPSQKSKIQESLGITPLIVLRQIAGNTENFTENQLRQALQLANESCHHYSPRLQGLYFPQEQWTQLLEGLVKSCDHDFKNYNPFLTEQERPEPTELQVNGNVFQVNPDLFRTALTRGASNYTITRTDIADVENTEKQKFSLEGKGSDVNLNQPIQELYNQNASIQDYYAPKMGLHYTICQEQRITGRAATKLWEFIDRTTDSNYYSSSIHNLITKITEPLILGGATKSFHQEFIYNPERNTLQIVSTASATCISSNGNARIPATFKIIEEIDLKKLNTPDKCITYRLGDVRFGAETTET